MELSHINKIQAPEESVIAINQIADFINSFSSNITLGDNMAGEIKTVTIPAGVEVGIAHSLKVVPKYKLTLKHVGNSEIYDGTTQWTDKQIYLNNAGANSVEITVLIMRG